MEIGALFDWDGVVIDSSRQHEESWERLATEERHVLPADHFKRGFGMKNEFIIPKLLGWASDPADVRRLSLRKEELYRVIVRERGIEPLPGVREFLERLRDAAVPCVVASSTQRANIELLVDAMHLRPFFLGWVTSEDVGHGKPHPEPFLKAAERANRAPSRCVVFEDALMGIEAGVASGAKVVAVATTNPRETLLSTGAHRIVDRLDELEVRDLVALFARAGPS